MNTEWVSLSEAAELEGITYNACKLRAFRETYKTKTEPNPAGGKDLVYIDVLSLSDEAQRRYKRRQRAELDKLRVERIKESGEPPWYVNCDFSWFMMHYEKKWKAAQGLAAVIEKYIRESKEHYRETTEFCDEFVSTHLDISSKQFRRYLARYKEGIRWAEIKECETGQSYDVFRIMALCPPPKKGKHSRLTPDICADIENLWASERYHQNLQSVQMLCEDLWDRLEKRGCEYKPSYNTVRRYCQELIYNNADVKTLLQKGVRGFKSESMIKCRRDIRSLKVMECVMGDAHTFDCWVEYTKENGKKTAIRPYLVGFIDVRSRCMVGWGICAQPNSEVLKQVLIHMMYPKKDSKIYGVPRVVYIDNGKDFTAETLTGRKRTVRFDIDGETKGFYKSMGIEYDKRALPYHAWAKGQIERCFGTVINRFTKRFASYTGTLTGSRTDGKVVKDIKALLESGELYTMEEFAAMFETWLETEYHQRPHEGLKEDGENNPVPEYVFTHSERYMQAAPPMDYAITLLGKCEVRSVHNYGIKVEGQTYMSEALAKYIGEKITVRYYTKGMGFICCSTLDGIKICNAYPAEKINPLAEQGDETLTGHLKMQKRQLKRAREDIKLLAMPFAQRELQLPELSDEPPKVVAVPQDRQYTENKKRESEKKQRYKNEFMQRQAEKAFRRIENL